MPLFRFAPHTCLPHHSQDTLRHLQPSVGLFAFRFSVARRDLDSTPPPFSSASAFSSLLSLADYAVEERPSEMVLMQQLEEGGPDPLVFVLNANLLAMVKLVNCELATVTLFNLL